MSTSHSDPEFGDIAPKPTRSRRGPTCVEACVVLAILFLLVMLFAPAIRSAREPARRAQCVNNLKQIGLALHNYAGRYGALPPAFSVDANGKPLHSWRTLILPFIEQENLYKTIDLSKPWDDPVNATAVATKLTVYICPSNVADGPNATTYQANVGPDGFLAIDRSRRLDEITDGTGTTLAVIETAESEAVPWMAPTDRGAVALLKLSPEGKLAHPGGANALIGDGSVRFLKADTSAAMRRALLTISGKDSDAVEFP